MQRISNLEKKYTDTYDWFKSKAEYVYKQSVDSRIQCDNATSLLNDCRKTMNSICDVGTDIGFHSTDHSWAVVCIHGKIDYVKFVSLTGQDTNEILRFLKMFEWSDRCTDSPLGFKRMIEDRIVRYDL